MNTVSQILETVAEQLILGRKEIGEKCKRTVDELIQAGKKEYDRLIMKGQSPREALDGAKERMANAITIIWEDYGLVRPKP